MTTRNQYLPKLYPECLFKILTLLVGMITFNSCKKFVTVNPPQTTIISASVYTNDASAVSVIEGIYSKMISDNGFSSGNSASVTLLTGLSSDELLNYAINSTTIYGEFYTNSLSPSNTFVRDNIWKLAYQYILTANSVIEGVQKSSSITLPIKEQLTGEAKFIRAFCHFYLVNLFGDIPLILTTDYRINSTADRAPTNQVYQQIISDLKDAQELLNDGYPKPDGSFYSVSSAERVRPNKATATALLARVYLYTDDYKNAEIQATSIINNSTYYSLSPLNSVFLKNSSEAIWQLMPNQAGKNTNEGSIFILTSSPSITALSNQQVNAFDSGDNRRSKWVDSIMVGSNTYYFSYKYKIQSGSTLSEYSMVLRLGEQYLIRSEARAQQNNISGAQSDLNTIRMRAGLSNTTASDKTSLLKAIEHERQAELFTEWGHRWLDLKRNNHADLVIGPIKGGNWQSTDVLYPIPVSEIIIDPNLTQNSGY